MKKTFLIFTLFISAAIAFCPSVALESAKGAVSLCINTLIPSLLPFIICSNLLISLGGAEIAARFTGKIMMPLFKINGSGSLPLIMGLLSGYPCGAVTLCNMYKQGHLSKNEAHRLLSFTNNSGPLFIISVVGLGVFGSALSGIILYFSHILAALTVGFISSLFADGKKDISAVSVKTDSAAESVSKSVLSVLNLCGFVIFFAVILGLFEKFKITYATGKLLCFFGAESSVASLLSKGIFEMATGISLSDCKNLPAISAVITLGGISVLFQTMSHTRGAGLSIKPYIAGKILGGGISAFYTKILVYFFPLSVFSPSLNEKLSAYTPYLISFIWATGIFVLFYSIASRRHIGLP